jgi:hypothetical protein
VKAFRTFLIFALAATPLLGASQEVSLTPTAVISPYSFWADPSQGRFYGPTGIQIGNYFYMYVQGGAYSNVTTGPGSECAAVGEEVLAFKTPWTAQGLRSPFTYVRTITPCRTDVPQVHYSPGSVFKSSMDGKYKILVSETENGSSPALGHWKRTLLGSSTDGENWAWSTFLKQSVVGTETYSVGGVTLVQATANTNWWGTYLWGGTGQGLWNVGRIRVIMDATNPRGYVIYLLASDGTFEAVNNDGSFNFVPGVAWNGPTEVASPHSIVLNNGTWEAWGDYAGLPATQGCEDNDPNNSSTFRYRTVSQTGPIGAIQEVTSAVRPMPTRNLYGRFSPFRINDMNGVRLLYSASADRMYCGGTGAGYKGSEIIVTEVDN